MKRLIVLCLVLCAACGGAAEQELWDKPNETFNHSGGFAGDDEHGLGGSVDAAGGTSTGGKSATGGSDVGGSVSAQTGGVSSGGILASTGGRVMVGNTGGNVVVVTGGSSSGGQPPSPSGGSNVGGKVSTGGSSIVNGGSVGSGGQPPCVDDRDRCTEGVCGKVVDSCGITKDCGSCDGGDACKLNKCEAPACVPKKCDDFWWEPNCGLLDNGCGGTVNCTKMICAVGNLCGSSSIAASQIGGGANVCGNLQRITNPDGSLNLPMGADPNVNCNFPAAQEKGKERNFIYMNPGNVSVTKSDACVDIPGYSGWWCCP